ncbi:hypothetical protein [Pseudoalteromonas piratica]|uniref:hypothetical protein n=1 Tax=Pseudoalteromonas piratica TaxID=1348114 RepID=UPI000ADF7025|nr:hypothetical protein [Pseudoalteromonas piratica]
MELKSGAANTREELSANPVMGIYFPNIGLQRLAIFSLSKFKGLDVIMALLSEALLLLDEL